MAVRVDVAVSCTPVNVLAVVHLPVVVLYTPPNLEKYVAAGNASLPVLEPMLKYGCSASVDGFLIS